LPVVRTIQNAWPETAITWIIGATEYQLFAGVSGVEFIILDKARGYRAYADVRRQLRGRRFPILLDMHASMRANIASCAVRADERIGFDKARAKDGQWLFTNRKIPANSRQHVMDGLFSFVETLGITDKLLRWDIPIADSDREIVNGLDTEGRPLCVISPCSSDRFRNFRNWSVENYVAVADFLGSRYGAHVVLTGGATDQERAYAAEICRAVARQVTDLVGHTSLKQLLALIECADLVICPDSGPAHMATAAGTPVVGLYATSNRHRTGPYCSQHLVVDEYPEAVRREFGKPVDALPWGKRVRDPNAMDLIRVESVIESVEQVLGSASSVQQ
jgi:heptosyltransferase I